MLGKDLLTEDEGLKLPCSSLKQHLLHLGSTFSNKNKDTLKIVIA